MYLPETARLTGERDALDQAMFDPAAADAKLAKLTMSELSVRRAEVHAALEAREAEWLAKSELLEQAA